MCQMSATLGSVTRMERLLTLSNGAALHRALKAAGAPVGYRTVARWVGDEPESKPDPELLPYLERVFGITKDGLPSEDDRPLMPLLEVRPAGSRTSS